MKIGFGCDHAAVELKEVLMAHLTERGFTCVDFGAMAPTERVNYPDKGLAVAEALIRGEVDKGVLLCGTGIGISLAANKVPGIRAAVCHDPFSTERSRKSNDAQIMCMGERVIGVELAKYLVDIWLKCDFAGGGSAPKVARINEVDASYRK